jgi:hypothetical protein
MSPRILIQGRTLAASALCLVACHRAPEGALLVSGLQISESNLAAAPELGSSAEQARSGLKLALESTRKFNVVEGSKDKLGARVRLEVESARQVLLPSIARETDREAEVLVSLELLIPDARGDLDRLVAEGSSRRPTPVDASGGPAPEGRSQAFEGALQGAMFEAATALSWQVEARKKSDADLEKDLTAGDARVRDYAVRALAERRNPAAVPLLLARLDDDSPEVVRRAMGALVAIGDPRAVRPLIDLTRKRPPQFVAEVLYALGSLGGVEAEAFLYTLESGAPDEEVRRAAHEALGDLRRRRDETAAAPPALHPQIVLPNPTAPPGSP